MERVKDISELVNGSKYVDCYTTTDVPELAGIEFFRCEGILNKVGFEEVKNENDHWAELLHTDNPDYLCAEFDNTPIMPKSLINKIGLRIDVVTYNLDNSQSEFGFVPMSKFRIYNGKLNIANELIAILKALEKERQNIAFVNDKATKAFVKLSEYFEPVKFESYEAWLESRAQ